MNLKRSLVRDVSFDFRGAGVRNLPHLVNQKKKKKKKKHFTYSTLYTGKNKIKINAAEGDGLKKINLTPTIKT